MAKKKKQKNNRKEDKKNSPPKNNKLPNVYLPIEVKNWIWGILIFIIAVIFALSFFQRAGMAGEQLKFIFEFVFGKIVFLMMPLILIFGGIIFFTTKYKKFFWPTLLAVSLMILGLSGMLNGFDSAEKDGGWFGYIISSPIVKFFNPLVNQIIFGSFILFGGLIFWYLLRPQAIPADPLRDEEKSEVKIKEINPEKSSLIKKIFFPKFQVKEIEPDAQPVAAQEGGEPRPDVSSGREAKPKEAIIKPLFFEYQNPPVDLLDSGKETPTAGDIRLNSAVIKKTLHNFDIPVEMSEVNIGPTVTQFTFKPAEGIKLSKITGLSNDLALSLAAHPIRIEAPIPGRSLVGIEIPNKVRAKVRLKDLIANPVFQSAASVLNLVLGRDVSGAPAY